MVKANQDNFPESNELSSHLIPPVASHREVVTAGGPGLPALAASYARCRGLELVPVPPDRVRSPGCAEEKRDERLVEPADAVVVAGELPDEPTRLLLARLWANGVRVSAVRPARREPAESAAHDERERPHRYTVPARRIT
jgi:hypothetical protein